MISPCCAAPAVVLATSTSRWDGHRCRRRGCTRCGRVFVTNEWYRELQRRDETATGVVS